MGMDFVQAMERLKRAIRDEDIAAATGVSVNTIRRTRADPSTRTYRPPPSGWEGVLIKLAEVRAAELTQLKDELQQSVTSASE